MTKFLIYHMYNPQLEPNSKSMMKTKLTLFVTVLAAALFGMGCASTKPPAHGAVKWNGHWYKHVPEVVTWTVANRRCENMGGHLVIIDSKEENDFVFDLANKIQVRDFLWIGMSDHIEEGTPKWVDGRKVSSTYNLWIKGNDNGLGSTKSDFGWMGLYVPDGGKKAMEKHWGLYLRWDEETKDAAESAVHGTTFICEWE